MQLNGYGIRPIRLNHDVLWVVPQNLDKVIIVKKLGDVVQNWGGATAELPQVLIGTHVTLERLRPDVHAAKLYEAFKDADQNWTYLPYGPFHSSAQYYKWITEVAEQNDPWFFALKDNATGKYVGVCAYLRIDPNMGTIEVGHINFAPDLQRSKAATETMFLMMQWAFEGGYRRYEWKCDALNAPSRRAAERFGFSYEGIFRQAAIVKGRNRDTAWFATIDSEWPALKEAFLSWLSSSNFDDQGKQRERLGNLTNLVRASSDPIL